MLEHEVSRFLDIIEHWYGVYVPYGQEAMCQYDKAAWVLLLV